MNRNQSAANNTLSFRIPFRGEEPIQKVMPKASQNLEFFLCKPCNPVKRNPVNPVLTKKTQNEPNLKSCQIAISVFPITAYCSLMAVDSPKNKPKRSQLNRSSSWSQTGAVVVRFGQLWHHLGQGMAQKYTQKQSFQSQKQGKHYFPVVTNLPDVVPKKMKLININPAPEKNRPCLIWGSRMRSNQAGIGLAGGLFSIWSKSFSVSACRA